MDVVDDCVTDMSKVRDALMLFINSADRDILEQRLNEGDFPSGLVREVLNIEGSEADLRPLVLIVAHALSKQSEVNREVKMMLIDLDNRQFESAAQR